MTSSSEIQVAGLGATGAPPEDSSFHLRYLIQTRREMRTRYMCQANQINPERNYPQHMVQPCL